MKELFSLARSPMHACQSAFDSRPAAAGRGLGGRRPDGFLGLSLSDRTIPFIVILLDKTVSVRYLHYDARLGRDGKTERHLLTCRALKAMTDR